MILWRLQELVETWNINVLADVVGQLVILFLFEFSRGKFSTFFIFNFILEYMLNDRCVVKEAVDIGSYAVVGFQDSLAGVANALMDFVALTLLTVELKGHLARGLLCSHRGVDW